MINKQYFKTDLPAGLVVFLVALPLCLGISLASGAPFFSGLISGIIGGIVIGSLSSSRLSVSGPAAGLAALVLASITNIGAFDLFLCAVLIAGILQVLMSVAKLGGIANYFPSSVVTGLLTSIGILIIAKQIPHAVGYDKNEKGILSDFVMEDSHDLLKHLMHIDLGVLIICIISIAVILIWDRPFIKKRIRFIPGALVAVLVAVAVNELFKATGSPLAVGGDHLVQIRAAKSAEEFFGFFTLPDFNGFLKGEIWMTGIMIAIIASLETLLSIEAIDNLDPEKRLTNTNRELFAQGLGNSVAGLIGGLPITSVIVRSTANLHSGARSKMSTIFHGILLLVCVVTIPGLLNYIPLSALAAILLLTGYKLCKFSVFAQMFRNGKYQYIPFMVTVGVILGIDLFGLYLPLKGEGLLIGVLAGLVSAFGAILHGNLKNSYFFHKDKHHEGDTIKIRLSEEVSFLNKASLRVTFDKLPENSKVIIDASHTDYIDFDVLGLIKEFKYIKAPLKNIDCELVGFKEVYGVHNLDNVQSVH
ncbi:MAG: SulP family inorganic anion transporter [Ferruginibacter sp.]